MRVTTDAVQILGGAGYLKDYPVKRVVDGPSTLEQLTAGLCTMAPVRTRSSATYPQCMDPLRLWRQS